MKITTILVLFALSAIAQGQLAGAARGLLEPIVLTLGAAFTFMASDKVDADSSKWSEWMTNTFSKKETNVFLIEDSKLVDVKADTTKTKPKFKQELTEKENQEMIWKEKEAKSKKEQGVEGKEEKLKKEI